jgi:hypothetical protein
LLERQLASLHVGWEAGAVLSEPRGMPSPLSPFPATPLKFRTAGFPQYGFKASLSDGTFPDVDPVKPTPGIPFTALGLSASFVLSKSLPLIPLSVGKGDGWNTAVRETNVPLPQGSSLRLGL